ncbi:MAG: hypothetical protein Q4A44_04685 [Bacteroidales bacterium]|nr:hypothetical protein [Bacteroidales bacterium]
MPSTLDLRSLIILDTAYTDREACGFKAFIAPKVGRDLPIADLPILLEDIKGLALYGDESKQLRPTDVFIMYPEAEKSWTAFKPADFATYEGQAFNGHAGEFSFYLFPQPLDMNPQVAMEAMAELVAERKCYDDIIIVSTSEWATPLRDALKRLNLTNQYHHAAMPFSLTDEVVNLGFPLLSAYGIDLNELKG